MSTLSITNVASDTGRSPRFARIAAHLLAFMEAFGAARRLAIAAEMNRPANPADLKILGVNGPLPRTR
jgi:hypothetical protein